MSEQTVRDLLSFAKEHSEEEIKAFITEHWAEFPQDIQDHLGVALMTDAALGAALAQLDDTNEPQ